MLEAFAPRYKIGCLQPNLVIDNHPYEFYRLAPPGVMLVMVGLGLKEFSSTDVERVFAPVDRHLDKLIDRGVDIIVQNGVPLPILIGLEAHDRLLAHIETYSGRPATTTVNCVTEAVRTLGVERIAIVNKWTPEMNQSLGRFLARAGGRIVGQATRELNPDDFHRLGSGEHMDLALELGRRAFHDNPDCDAVYIGGGSWLAEPVACALEAEFGKPVICNQSAVIRKTLQMLGMWTPLPGHSRLLSM